jgi:hypothetical protein
MLLGKTRLALVGLLVLVVVGAALWILAAPFFVSLPPPALFAFKSTHFYVV